MRYQLVSILSALLLCLTMLAAIVYGVGTQPALMQTLMLRTAPPEATGFPAEQYGAAAKLITDYLKGEGDFQLVFSMNGIAYNAFNEREQTHMADVRTLFSLCRRFSLGSILLTLVGWLYSRKQRFFWRIVRRTACCMLRLSPSLRCWRRWILTGCSSSSIKSPSQTTCGCSIRKRICSSV